MSRILFKRLFLFRGVFFFFIIFGCYFLDKRQNFINIYFVCVQSKYDKYISIRNMMLKNFIFCLFIVVKEEIYYSDVDEIKNIGMNVVYMFNEYCIYYLI